MLVKGARVRVYWNLHKKTFSIMATGTGRVIGHSDMVTLTDVEFVVRQAGRNRVRKTGKKNVHAFAVGTLDRWQDLKPWERVVQDTDWVAPYVPITYNPYRDETFVTKGASRTPVHKASLVRMIGAGVVPNVFPMVVAEGVI